MTRRLPVAGAHRHSALAQDLFLAREILRILLGADDVSDDRQLAAGVSHTLVCLGEHGIEGTGGVGMSAVADDEVEEEHADAGIGLGLDDRGVALTGIDDRMRTSARVLLRAEIDEAVRRVADEPPRLLAQRAARVEPANLPSHPS